MKKERVAREVECPYCRVTIPLSTLPLEPMESEVASRHALKNIKPGRKKGKLAIWMKHSETSSRCLCLQCRINSLLKEWSRNRAHLAFQRTIIAGGNYLEADTLSNLADEALKLWPYAWPGTPVPKDVGRWLDAAAEVKQPPLEYPIPDPNYIRLEHKVMHRNPRMCRNPLCTRPRPHRFHPMQHGPKLPLDKPQPLPVV